MARIYQRKVGSKFGNQYYEADGNSGQYLQNLGGGLSQQAAATKQQAQQLYGTELDFETETQFNELINTPEYSANPEALKERLNGVIKGIADNIADDNLRASFLTGAQKSSMQYVNQALNNRTSAIKEAEREAKADAKAAAAEERQIARENRAEQRAIAREQRTAARQGTKDARTRAVNMYSAQLKAQMQELYQQSSEDATGLNSQYTKALANIVNQMPDQDMAFDVINKVMPSYFKYTDQAFNNARSAAKTQEQRQYSEETYQAHKAQSIAYQEGKEEGKQREQQIKDNNQAAQDRALANFEYELNGLLADNSTAANIGAFTNQAYIKLGEQAAGFDDEAEKQKFITAGIENINKKFDKVNSNQKTAEKQQQADITKIIDDNLSNSASSFFNYAMQNDELKASPAKLKEESDKWYKEQVKNITEQGVSDVSQAKFQNEYAKQLNTAMQQADSNARQRFEANKRQTAEEGYRQGVNNLIRLSQVLQVNPALRNADYAADIVEQKEKINAYVYARDSNRDYIFTDSQRTAMLRDAEKALIDNEKQRFLDLPLNAKETYKQDLLTGIKTPSGDFVQMFSPEAEQELLKYANDWKEKHDDEIAKANTEEEASAAASDYINAKAGLTGQYNDMFVLDKRGNPQRLKGKTELRDMIEYRLALDEAYNNGNVDNEEYKQLYDKTQKYFDTLLNDYETNEVWKKPYLSVAYDKLKGRFIDSDSFDNATKGEYLQQLYAELSEQGLNPMRRNRRTAISADAQNKIDKAVDKVAGIKPETQQAAAAFLQVLSPSIALNATKEFASKYKKDMTEQEKNNLISSIAQTQQTLAEYRANTVADNVSYYPTPEEQDFMNQNNLSYEDVVYTAQIHGESVQEVLRRLREKRTNATPWSNEDA